MAKVEPIDASIFSAWRAAWEDAALFSDDAIRDLRARIGSHHFYVVISVTIHGQPISCVFQNVPPRPQPVRSTDRSKAAHFSPDGWGSDPGIYLDAGRTAVLFRGGAGARRGIGTVGELSDDLCS